MHKFIIFLILSLSHIPIFSYAQQKDPAIPSLDQNTLMPLLFKNGTFNSRNEFIWKPSTPPNQEDIISDDGNCYTRYDTLIYFKGKDPVNHIGSERASIVFSTSLYRQGTRMDCHVCAPVLGLATFTKTGKGTWRLDQFHPLMKSHGGFGEGGRLSVERFSEELFCLKVSDHYMNQGYYSEYITYYSLSGRHNIVLAFESYATNDGTDEKDIYHRKTRVRKNAGNLLSLDLTTIEEADGKTAIKKYQYSNTTETFGLIAPKGQK